MHPMITTMRARGLGDDYDPLADPNYIPGILGGGGSTGHGINWNNIITQGIQFGQNTLNSFFASRAAPYTGFYPGSNQYPQGGYSQQLTPEQIDYMRRQQQDSLSGSINSRGIKFGNSYISWPVIGLGVLGFALIQSKGFERRK